VSIRNEAPHLRVADGNAFRREVAILYKFGIAVHELDRVSGVEAQLVVGAVRTTRINTELGETSKDTIHGTSARVHVDTVDNFCVLWLRKHLEILGAA